MSPETIETALRIHTEQKFHQDQADRLFQELMKILNSLTPAELGEYIHRANKEPVQ